MVIIAHSNKAPAHDNSFERTQRAMSFAYPNATPPVGLLNLDVRQSEMTSRRLVELMVGGSLVGYCGYAIHMGSVVGRFRSYSRREEPWKFWAIILITLAFGVVFLLGAVTWRS